MKVANSSSRTLHSICDSLLIALSLTDDGRLSTLLKCSAHLFKIASLSVRSVLPVTVLSSDNQADVIKAFNLTSRYLDDLLNIDNPYFEGMVNEIYPSELELNKANTSQLIRFARVCSHIDDFNTRNKCLTVKLLKQGYQYHKLRKAFS